MSTTNNQRTTSGLLLFGPLSLFLFGLVALYIGERALVEKARWVVSGLGGLSLVVALGLGFVRQRGFDGDRRRGAMRIFIEYAVAFLAVLLYGAQTTELDLVREGKLHTILQVGWPALLLLALLPAVAMELAFFSMERAPRLEVWRIRFAGTSARIVALAMVSFAGLNFVAAKWNRKIDLSYFKTTEPGSATVALVKNSTKALEFTLFFPPGNDVAVQAREYVEALVGSNPLASARVVDQALEPELSKKLKVRGNGYIAITHEAKTETLRLGLDLEDARSALRELDAKVQQSLIKVLRPPRVAYFTAGHMERDYAPPADDKRLGLRELRSLLEALGFKVKRLGLSEGLGKEVPEDASLVIVAGPTEPFLPEERAALHSFANRGGALLILIDPDTGVLESELLAPLGVQVSKALVANDLYLVRLADRAESPYYLATSRVSAHPSVDTLSQAAGRLYTVLLGAGALSKTENPPADVTTTFTLRAMPQSWVDKNQNGKFDKGLENRDAIDFSAAIEKPLPTEADKKRSLRAIVIADTDVAGDGLVGNAGNGYLLADCVRWLVNDEESAGETKSEEDVAIVHKKDEDAKWFYGTSFIFPAAILGGGLFVSRRRRQKERDA
jgi:hypothetical protein